MKPAIHYSVRMARGPLVAALLFASLSLGPDPGISQGLPSTGNKPGSVIGEEFLLTPNSAKNSQPAIAAGGDNKIWTTWVTHIEGEGDKIVLRGFKDDIISPPIEITPEYGDYLAPAILSDAGNRLWVFWSAITGGKSRIYCRRLEENKWRPPLLLTDSFASDSHPAICRGSDGKIWMAWQSAALDRDAINLASVGPRGLNTPILGISASGNNRDPVIAGDSNGKLWIAWSAAEDNTYRIKLRSFQNGRLSPEITVSHDPAMYHMHPSLAVDRDDNLWIAWDSFYLRNQGDSGGSKISYYLKQKTHPPVTKKIRLVKYDGHSFSQTRLKDPENGITPPGYELPKHGAFPRITIDADQRIWAFYRTWSHVAYPENYYYSVVGQTYASDRWLGPIDIPSSTGPMEKVAAAAAHPGGIFLAYAVDEQEQLRGWQVLKTKEQLKTTWSGDYTSARVDRPKIYLRDLKFWGKSPGPASPLTSPRSPIKVTAPPSPPMLNLANPFVTGQKHYQVQVNDNNYRVYWGNLHSHSNISRCSVGGEPPLREYYDYMRDIGLYDFCVLTDHVEHITLYDWWRTSQIADLCNIPGRFVTLFGYEWTGRAGHKNVFYPHRGQTVFSSILAEAGTPDNLWKTLGDSKAITIPHHPAAANLPTDWNYHNDKFERLVEIFQSCRGSYEYAGCPRQPSNLSPEVTKKGAFVQDALARGYHMGFVGASDHGYGLAYTAVYAPDLTRDAVFDALYQRRCYAATEKGIFLDFRADGHLMGEEYTTNNPPKITGTVIGTRELSRIDVFKNGEIVYTYPAPESKENRTNIHLEWAEIPESWEGTLRLSEGHFLPSPSSDPEKKEIKNEFHWVSGTPGRWSFRHDLIAESPATALLALELPGLKKKYSLREIIAGEIIIDLNPGKLMLKKGDVPTQSLRTDQARFEFTDDNFVHGTSWYYLRAIQMNGEMAWSSPIWISKKDGEQGKEIRSLGYSL
jgi:uncharacterized protein DUF3604